MLRKKKEFLNQKCKNLIPNAHTFEELVAYISTKYQATKVSNQSSSYVEEYRNIKSNLVLKERPDLIHTPMPAHPKNEQLSDPESMSAYFKQMEQRTREAYTIKDSVFPIDLEQYLIHVEDDGFSIALLVNLEYEFGLLNVSSQYDPGIKTELTNQCHQIIKDIYHYYGVTKEDIETQNERCRTYIHKVG